MHDKTGVVTPTVDLKGNRLLFRDYAKAKINKDIKHIFYVTCKILQMFSKSTDFNVTIYPLVRENFSFISGV
jgi:hypothetical protein